MRVCWEEEEGDKGLKIGGEVIFTKPVSGHGYYFLSVPCTLLSVIVVQSGLVGQESIPSLCFLQCPGLFETWPSAYHLPSCKSY